MIVARAFAGRHFAVLGLARSGLATIDALLASGASVTAWDDREEARDRAASGALLGDFVTGDLSAFDAIVITPGVPLNRHPIAARARAAGVDIIGDIELFARARNELAQHRLVGITGTNGKSTTTALVHHILQTAGVATTMGGNIGLPILAQDPLPAGGVYVLELSSYQLDLTQSLDCDIAVLLNITPDHLDRYDSFAAYAASKCRLLAMQSADHAALVDGRAVDAGLIEGGERALSPIESADAAEQAGWPALQGPHNGENAGAARQVCRWLGVADTHIEIGLRSFGGLPHRMERVAQIDGVLFVNDSKATNPTAAAPALAAFERTRWICGGQAKSDSLDECAPHFSHVLKAYTIGEAGEMFASLLSPCMAVAKCGTLEKAVKAAAFDARPGDTILLSPACASFDQFRDFEARGEAFRAAVGEL